MQHTVVYREPGRFAGWPANHGIWSWGNEIVVGFELGYLKPGPGFHAIDEERPKVPAQARSLDGGETWQVEQPLFVRPSAGRHSSIRFTHPDFALRCRRSGTEAGAIAWYYISYDRCRTWQGPYDLPMFGQTGVPARTDYIVQGPERCLLFLTAAKSDGREGRPFCAQTTDGGQTFEFLSWIGPEPEGFAIMPASVQLSASRLLVAVRCKEGADDFVTAQHCIELYASDDAGVTWTYLARPVADTGVGGNPATLTRLSDGRLCLTYGYRKPPYGMRATVSSDGGVTWGEEIILRDDAGSHDIGYPRTVLRSDGTVVTVYYYNDHPAGERYIAATLWRP